MVLEVRFRNQSQKTPGKSQLVEREKYPWKLSSCMDGQEESEELSAGSSIGN